MENVVKINLKLAQLPKHNLNISNFDDVSMNSFEDKKNFWLVVAVIVKIWIIIS